MEQKQYFLIIINSNTHKTLL